MLDWHRALGITLTCEFHDTQWTVEIEKELAIKAQRLDVLVVRRGQGPDRQPRPDGLEDMTEHNLLTYKSLREAMDDWALKELTGHYVNYRKLASPSMDHLLSEDGFRLYAVSTRFPVKLQGQTELIRRSGGIYDVRRGTDEIRLIVLSQLPRQPHNAPWLLFSGEPQSVEYARRHLRHDTGEMAAVVQDLLSLYQVENVPMTYTLQDYRKELISRLTEEELAEAPLVKKLRKEADEKQKRLEVEQKRVEEEQKRADAAERHVSEHFDRAMLVGEIHSYQRLLNEPLTARVELLEKSKEELKALSEEWARKFSHP